MSLVVDELTRRGGVAGHAKLRHIASGRQSRNALDAGLVGRPRRGRCVLPLTDEARRVAHTLSGVLSHRSAALALGWKVRFPPEKPAVMVPRNLKIRAGSKRLAVIRNARLEVGDVSDGVTACRSGRSSTAPTSFPSTRPSPSPTPRCVRGHWPA